MPDTIIWPTRVLCWFYPALTWDCLANRQDCDVVFLVGDLWVPVNIGYCSSLHNSSINSRHSPWVHKHKLYQSLYASVLFDLVKKIWHQKYCHLCCLKDQLFASAPVWSFCDSKKILLALELVGVAQLRLCLGTSAGAEQFWYLFNEMGAKKCKEHFLLCCSVGWDTHKYFTWTHSCMLRFATFKTLLLFFCV